MIAGPNNIAASPTPVGCEELPVTDGIFKADKTNANAPTTAINIFIFESISIFFFIFVKPTKIKGRHRIPQTPHHNGGKKPSIICIEKLFTPSIKNNKKTRFFLLNFISPPL